MTQQMGSGESGRMQSVEGAEVQRQAMAEVPRETPVPAGILGDIALAPLVAVGNSSERNYQMLDESPHAYIRDHASRHWAVRHATANQQMRFA